MSSTTDCTDVAAAIAAGEVTKLAVYSIQDGKTFVEITDLSQLAALVGGPGKRVTVDGQDATAVSGAPLGTEAVTVSAEKGSQG